MRIEDVNTTDIYADRSGFPFRIVQLGPRKGGRYWKRTGWNDDLPQFSTTKRDNQSVFQAHLAVTSTKVSHHQELAALSIPEWTGDDDQDTLLAKHWNEQLKTNKDYKLFLDIVNTRNLKPWSVHLENEAIEQARFAQMSQAHDRDLAALEEFKPMLVDMLVDAGINRDDVARPGAINMYPNRENACIYLPLEWIRVINQSTPPH